ncbi:DUF952 domain-containing protein [Nocardioides sp. Bht2]|uniref:DUF952 domain-containing protein n=1 Tax=Nocardioides sp. Bht2 TaxID=3392297 RepID=UPI0039B66BE3
MLIFHIAEKARWEAAELAGSYAWSTLGRTLDDEGFLHASRADQVAGVLGRFYRGHQGELVLLTIDTDLLSSPWREDQVGDDTYPHIYGPLNPSAVTDVQPVTADPAPATGTAAAAGSPRPPRTLLQLWLSEFLFRIAMAVFVMAVATAAGVAVAAGYRESWGLAGMIAGAALALALVVPLARRRSARANR